MKRVTIPAPMPRAFGATFLLLFAAQGAAPELELDALVRARSERSSAGDAAGADRVLAELEQKRIALGVRNLPLASATLIYEARIALAAKRPERTERAVYLAEAAARLSPDLPATHALLLQSYLAHRPATISMIARAGRDCARAIFAGAGATSVLAANALAYFGIAFVATILIFALLQLIKYVKVTGFWLPVLAAAPPILNLGLLTSAALVLSAVYTMQTVREKRVSLLALLLSACAPYAIDRAVLWAFALDEVTRTALVRDLGAPVLGDLPAWGLMLVCYLAALSALLRARAAGRATAAIARASTANISTSPAANTRRAIFAVIPGINDMIDDRPLAGTILFFIFSTSVAAIYWLDGVLPDQFAFGIDIPGMIPKLLLAASAIAISVFISTRRPLTWH